MPEAEYHLGCGASGSGDLRAWTVERVEGHEWRVEIREHKLAEWKHKRGLPITSIFLRLDGELLASIYPAQQGFGLHIVSDHLDFDDPVRMKGDLPASVVYYKKGSNPFMNMPQGGENGNSR